MDNTEQSSGMTFEETSKRFMDIFDEPGSIVQPVGVKLILKGHEIPEGTKPPEEYQGVPWCEAVRIAAMDGEVVVINKGNVGCPAAAIALGLVDQYQEEPLSGTRKYTDMMETAASPADFTNGIVYGCKASDNMQFALFGEGDTGRYETLGAALNAVAGMTSIQPDIMDAAVAYPAGKLDITPDVVILGLLPKQVLLADGKATCSGSGCRYRYLSGWLQAWSGQQADSRTKHIPKTGGRDEWHITIAA
jgi:uncharacterized protein (DUF169 family)